MGFVENQQNGVTGEAGHRLATHYALSPDIPMSMDEHVPFDNQGFLPVTQDLTDRLFPASEAQSPPTSEKEDLLRPAEGLGFGEASGRSSSPHTSPWRICRPLRWSRYWS